MTKECRKCSKKQSISLFGRHKNTKDQLNTWCNPCRREYEKEWKKRQPNFKEKSRAYWLKHAYNLRPEDVPAQCEICGGKDKAWICVDHCHTTGKTRGFLCDRCNVVLGRVNDSTLLLKKMIRYLLKAKKKTSA